MTVASALNKVIYDGNDSTTVFPYSFPIRANAHAKVYLTEIDGTEVLLTETTDYTISGIDDDNGGNVTYPVTGSPLATGEKLTILRVVPETQETDLQNQGAFLAETHEARFDLNVMMIQQHGEELDRCLKVDLSSDETPEELMTSLFDARDEAVAAAAAAAASEAAAAASEAAAIAAQAAAEAAQTAAEAAQTGSEAAQTAAEAAQTAAEAAQTAAETAQGLAETAQAAAEAAQTAAETAQTGAETAETGAQTAQGLAETAQTAAEAAQTAAEAAQTAAEAAQTAAETAQTGAETAETNAAASEVAAAASAASAQETADDLIAISLIPAMFHLGAQ